MTADAASAADPDRQMLLATLVDANAARANPAQRPVHELLADIADVMRGVDPRDLAMVFATAWRVICVASGTGQLLAAVGSPGHGQSSYDTAGVIADALRAIRHAHSAPTTLAPVGLAVMKLPATLDAAQIDFLNAGIGMLAAACCDTAAPASTYCADATDRAACESIATTGLQLLHFYPNT